MQLVRLYSRPHHFLTPGSPGTLFFSRPTTTRYTLRIYPRKNTHLRIDRLTFCVLPLSVLLGGERIVTPGTTAGDGYHLQQPQQPQQPPGTNAYRAASFAAMNSNTSTAASSSSSSS
eukprot:COSAG06_NODE_10157_length_1738_cov_2.986577_1_plen_116_part_10